MKPEIKFEDFAKLEFLVGEVVDIKENLIEVDIGDRILKSGKSFEIEKGKKIVVGVNDEDLIFLLAGDSVISPEKDIGNGSRVR